jgi:hypothetical protein
MKSGKEERKGRWMMEGMEGRICNKRAKDWRIRDRKERWTMMEGESLMK